MFLDRGIRTLRARVQRAPGASVNAWTVSLLLHCLLLFLLSCFILTTRMREHFLTLNAQRPMPMTSLDFAASVAVEPRLATDAADTSLEIPVMLPQVHDPAPLAVLEPWEFEAVEKIELGTEPPTSTELRERPNVERKMPWEIRKPATTESITSVNGVAAALGPIEQAIRDEVTKGDTLVVWLMDASISLQLNRRLIAEKLAGFQISLGLGTRKQGLSSRDNDHRLFNSVVAFGKGVVEIHGPTLTGLRAVERIAGLPSDPSGMEQTMYAVNQVVQLYRGKRRRKERMIIVLLTDESGDDGMAVEATVLNCRQHGVAVHVIGPTAVMGLEEGAQLWTSNANQRFLLKVKRGPETCLPERVFLPYWHELRLSAWRPDVRPADSVPWYGGEYREGVLSGFGPYTLTRLALQTGGSFTRFDQGGDARYDPDKLRPYFPEYGSLAEYQASIRDRPLRMFVAEAAAMTFNNADLFVPLRMMFFGSRSAQYPYAIESRYMAPARFRRELRNAIEPEMRRALSAAQRIGSLLQRFDQHDLEYEYAREDSRRWRAWYDLTRGRLLAASVRYAEYIATCELLANRKPPIGEEVNEVLLVAGSQFRVPSSAERAHEARRLLERCRVENESTPWSDLAGWEFASDFGIRTLTKEIPLPPPIIQTGLPASQMGLKGTSMMGGGGGGGAMSFPSL